MNNFEFRGGGRVSPALLCLLVALAGLLAIAGPARADHPNETEVTASLGEKPSVLEDVTVQVQDTQGPQFLIENNTGKMLEVYDSKGVPFVRIGPEGVKANRKAKTFYQTYGPEGILVAKEARKATNKEARAEPEWVQVSDQRSWGWFDHRLQTEDVAVPEKIAHDGEAANFGEWEVPVSLGDTETSLEGSYRYEPEPKGAYVADLTSEPRLSEVETQLAQGYGGATALLLRNEGEEPVTVLDGSGKPAIEIGPDEVRVNTNSSVGREANRGAGTTGTTAGTTSGGEQQGRSAERQPQWQTIAGGSSFAWQDPRLSPPDGQSQPPASNVTESQEVAQWKIPIESSGESSTVEGAIEWKPLEGESGSGESGAGGATGGSGDSGHDDSGHDHSGNDHSEDGASQDGEAEAASADLNPVSEVGVATIVPVAGLLVAASAGGALLYSRWRGSR